MISNEKKVIALCKTGVKLIWKITDYKNDAISKILMKNGHVKFEIATKLDKNSMSKAGISLVHMFTEDLVEDCEHPWIFSV